MRCCRRLRATGCRVRFEAANMRHRTLLILLALCVLPVLAPRGILARQDGSCASYGAGSLPLAGYEQCVREAYVAARNADRIGLDEIAPRLEIREVQLDGSVLPVDNTWLADALAQEPPSYPLIESRLAAIIDALAAERTPPAGDSLAALDDVFERPPFQDRELPSAWSRFWAAVGDAIIDFLRWISGALPSSGPAGVPATPNPFTTLTPVGWALLIGGLLLVLGLLVYAVRAVRRSLLRDASVKAAAAEEHTLSSGQALDRANIEAQAGDYRGAVRFLYLGALLWLDERKLLRYDRSLTNREYLEATRDDTPLHERLAPVVGTFDRVVYGHRELSEADFRAYQQQVDALRELEGKL